MSGSALIVYKDRDPSRHTFEQREGYQTMDGGRWGREELQASGEEQDYYLLPFGTFEITYS